MPKEKNLITSLPARMFFAYLVPMFFARVESSSNILQLLATGLNPAICLQMTTLLQPSLFL
jgi:hypothetical protein